MNRLPLLRIFKIHAAGYCYFFLLLWLCSVSTLYADNLVANDKLAQNNPLPTASSPVSPSNPEIVDLGNGHYRIGEIVVDKPGKSFRVTGVVLRTEPPLEFLISTKGGSKAYESLLEVNANAFEFNLACILIGLDPKKSVAPTFHFAPELAQGDAVGLWVSWNKNGKSVRMSAADLLLEGGKPVVPNDWVYTGSNFTANGQYMAEIDGTLVGFVHDPASIIEHKQGVALGNYGDVATRPDILPPVGGEISLVVENLEDR